MNGKGGGYDDNMVYVYNDNDADNVDISTEFDDDDDDDDDYRRYNDNDDASFFFECDLGCTSSVLTFIHNTFPNCKLRSSVWRCLVS